MQNPALQDILNKINAKQNGIAETRAPHLTDLEISPQRETTCPTTTPPQPQKRTRRKWTAEDYLIRGIKTPEERSKEARTKLHADVAPETMAKVRAYAIENGVSIGRAVDRLVELGSDV